MVERVVWIIPASRVIKDLVERLSLMLPAGEPSSPERHLHALLSDWPKPSDAIAFIRTTLQFVFGDQVPPWIWRTVGVILLLALSLVGIFGLLTVLAKIKDLWVKEFWPLFYSRNEKRRVERRRRFADHVESEIRRLNNMEAWTDYRFAELEAEVEAEGKRQPAAVALFTKTGRSGLRRERSLAKALQTSQERLILVEGEPGAGKSVALRHVVQLLARKAMKARHATAPIPIYLNLKELKPGGEDGIDKHLIRKFILRALNRANDRDIEEFLEEEFDSGLRDGTWIFLFDSFDETPDVLSSTEADSTTRTYSDAIADFLHGMNRCRGIVASRHFRGPGQSGWPRFRILPMSESRRQELIRKAGLTTDIEAALITQIHSTDEIRGMSSNPMFLGLLCASVDTRNRPMMDT